MKRFEVDVSMGGENGCSSVGVMSEDKDGDYVLHAEACPQWTRSTPTKPGAYWFKPDVRGVPLNELVEVCEKPWGEEPSRLFGTAVHSNVVVRYWLTDSYWCGQWCGPLYNPDAS